MKNNQNITFKEIYKNGYGKIPKFVMENTQISIGAKAIYAYFCSYGDNTKIFPTTETICNDLGFCYNTLYKCTKELTDISLITKYQYKYNDKSNTKYGNNIYMLNFKDDIKKGFGYISKSMMKNNNISYKAKTLYAYICALAGKDGFIAPKENLICKYLNITLTSLKKYLKELIDNQLIFIDLYVSKTLKNKVKLYIINYKALSNVHEKNIIRKIGRRKYN